MPIHLQPEGSYYCGYFAVMNAFARHGFEAPTLETLRQTLISNGMDYYAENFHTRGIDSRGISNLLYFLGWRSLCAWIPANSSAEEAIPPLLTNGATVLVHHNSLSGGGMAHWVLVEKAQDSGLSVICSIQGESFIPWNMRSKNQNIGIGHDFVMAWPSRDTHGEYLLLQTR